MKQKKEWKFIEGYNEYYRISNEGVIQNKYGRKLTYELSNVGYYTVRLNFEKNRIIAAVHRLVAKYFVENPNKYNTVKHLDNNKLNNNYLNLEWDTHQGNMQDAWKEGLCENTRNNGRLNGANNGKKSSSIPIVKLDYNLFLIKEYPSINDAAKDMGVRACTINSCCIGSARSAFGYIWKYKTEYQKIREYWYNEFKQTISVGILNQINDLPTHKVPEQCPDVKYLMDGSWDKYKEYIYYNPDKPMSFDDWKYMIENYKGESSNIIHKHIGVIVGVGSQMLIPEERYEVMKNLKPDLSAIKSIVPIADVIPEEIISKQEFLEMHDKAVERSITEETYKESRAWDIKKEKKVSHKRNNKRK